MIKTGASDIRESLFGKGSQDSYSQIEGQDYDFDMEDSSYDQRSATNKTNG